MKFEEKFKDTLNDGEVLQKILKPNKGLYVFGYLFPMIIPLLFMTIVITIVTIGIPTDGSTGMWIPPVVLLGVLLLMFIIGLPIVLVSHKNIFYAVTNKRVIIRSGIFGIDFKSMDLNDINAVETYVSVLDKIAKKNTGTINFGSPTRPILAVQGGRMGSTFKFVYILDPYAVAKELKAMVDSKKKGKDYTLKVEEPKVEQKTDAEAPSKSNKPIEKTMEQIEKLNAMKAAGAITETEYNKLKAKILSE